MNQLDQKQVYEFNIIILVQILDIDHFFERQYFNTWIEFKFQKELSKLTVLNRRYSILAPKEKGTFCLISYSKFCKEYFIN